jgi:hypothetical protein
MINIITIGITLDSGVVPPLSRQMPVMRLCGVTLDSGLIPPKNYFRPKVSITSVLYDEAPAAILTYQLM